jgi:CRP/FNR family transcriptional regulator
MMPTAANSVCRICPYREQSVFCELPEHRLDEFSRLKLVSRYQKGQRIFYEGEPNLGLSILCSGKVKLDRTSNAGKTQILNIVGPCGLLGEKDLFLSDRHTVSAEALEDSVVGFVKKEDFLAFLTDNATVALRVIRRLAEQLAKIEDRSFALTALDVRQRLAALLLDLADQHGKTVPGECLIDVALTRENLAEMIGATPETVIRVLSAFRKDGVIKDTTKQLVVLRPDELQRIAAS